MTPSMKALSPAVSASVSSETFPVPIMISITQLDIARERAAELEMSGSRDAPPKVTAQ